MEGTGHGFGGEDLETDEAARVSVGHVQAVHARQRRQLIFQGLEEGFQAFRSPVHLDVHPGGGVAHPAAQLVTGSQAVDERSKSDTLHDTGNM